MKSYPEKLSECTCPISAPETSRVFEMKYFSRATFVAPETITFTSDAGPRALFEIDTVSIRESN